MKFEHKALLIGGVAGTLIGLTAAFLYVKANEDQIAAVEAGEAEAVSKISPGEGLAVTLALIALLRQIVGMGSK
jgi:hypothetical protein